MNEEQIIGRLEYWREMLHTASGDMKNGAKHYFNPLTYAETIQQIEEDENIKDYFNVNIVFYKDLEYKWQYEIRRMYRNLEKTTFGYAESNVFKEFFETRLEAQKACAEHLITLIGWCIDTLSETE